MDKIMERGHQYRQDSVVAIGEEVLDENMMEFQRVLGLVGNVVACQGQSHVLPQCFDQLAISLDSAKRSDEIFRCQQEPILPAVMRGADVHDQIELRLPQCIEWIGVVLASNAEVNVRDERRVCMLWICACWRRLENPFQVLMQRSRLGGIDASSAHCFDSVCLQELPSSCKERTIEQKLFVEPLQNAAKLRCTNTLIKLRANVFEQVCNGQGAIEQLEQCGKFWLEFKVWPNVATGILESDHAATAVEDEPEFSA